MDNFSMIRNLNMMSKSYEIVYIFVTPPPLTRCYLISENVDMWLMSMLPLFLFLWMQ